MKWTAAILVVAVCAAPCLAEGLAVTGLGMGMNQDFQFREFQLRVGWERAMTEVGGFLAFEADVTDQTPDDDRYGGGLYATFNIIGDPNSLLGAFRPLGNIETSLYAGLMGGMWEGNDAIGRTIVGGRIGPVVAEWQYAPTSNIWPALPDTTRRNRLFVGARWVFEF